MTKKYDFGDGIDLELDPAEFDLQQQAKESGTVVELSDLATPANQLADASEPAEQTAVAHHLMLSGVEVALPDDETSLWNYVTDKMNLSAISAAQAGYALLKLKDQAGHSNFKPELERRGLNCRVARESMQLATMLMNQPEEIQNQLTKMGKSQLIAIAKLDDEEIKDLAESDDFDELSTLSVRELRKTIRQTQASLETKKLDLDQANQRVADSRIRSTKFPEVVLHVREEAAMASLNITKQIDDLEAMLNHMQSAEFVDGLTPIAKSADQNATERDAAGGAVFNAIASGLSRLHELLKDYDERGGKRYGLGDYIPKLDDLELTRVGSMWNIEKSMQDMKKQEAKAQRTNEARKGKRGRPVSTGKS